MPGYGHELWQSRKRKRGEKAGGQAGGKKRFMGGHNRGHWTGFSNLGPEKSMNIFPAFGIRN